MTKIDISNDNLDVTFQTIITFKQITKFVEDQYIPYRIYETDEGFDKIDKSWIHNNYVDGKPLMGGKDNKGIYFILEPLHNDLKNIEIFDKIEYCRDLLIRIRSFQIDLTNRTFNAREKKAIRANLAKLIDIFYNDYHVDVNSLEGKELGKFILDHYGIIADDYSGLNLADIVRAFLNEFNTDFKSGKVRSAIRVATNRK